MQIKNTIALLALAGGVAAGCGDACAQKVYSVDRSYQADKKVYFVDHEYQADLKIYFTDKEYRAGW